MIQEVMAGESWAKAEEDRTRARRGALVRMVRVWRSDRKMPEKFDQGGPRAKYFHALSPAVGSGNSFTTTCAAASIGTSNATAVASVDRNDPMRLIADHISLRASAAKTCVW